MSTTLTIAWKEFRSFVNSAIAYVFLVLFLLFLGGSYFIWGTPGELQKLTFFTLKLTDAGPWFQLFPMAFVILVPALSMRLWPDELKLGTVELLLSYPLRSVQVVLGKFLAGLGLIAAGILLTVTTPYVISRYGNFDWGPVIGAYVGSFLMGAAFLSVGLFMGALCREQVTAFILTLVICLLLVVSGQPSINQFIPESWQGISDAVSFSSRFQDLGTGVVDLGDVVYFVTFTALFLVLNVCVIECRKGR